MNSSHSARLFPLVLRRFRLQAASQTKARNLYRFIRVTPTPIPLRKRSGYFSPFSACSLVLNGFDNGVNSRSTYSKNKSLLDYFLHVKLIARRWSGFYARAASLHRQYESRGRNGRRVLWANPHATLSPGSFVRKSRGQTHERDVTM